MRITRSGSTLLELIVTVSMMAIVMGTLVMLLVSGLHVWVSGSDRAGARTQAAQALELMVRDLRKATAVTAMTANSIIFIADLAEAGGAKAYRFHLYRTPGQTLYQLYRGAGADADGQGMVIASSLDGGGSGFSRSGNVITVTLRVNINGQIIYLRTAVRPRNL